MQFAYPQGRIYLILAFALAMLALFELARKRQALRRLAHQGIHQPGIMVRPARQIFKCSLMLVIASLLGLAVLGPQWGWREEEMPPRRGRDLLILLDVSRSMLAEDVAPNRLERAKANLRDLAGFLEVAGGFRIGLIAFAERAAVMCPLTSDFRCFGEELADASLDSLRIRGRTAWADGTQVCLALDRAGRLIDDANAPYTDILLASDGEDMARETLSEAESLARRGITVHTLGLGDSIHEALIPVHDRLGRPAHLRYRGELVHTHLKEDVLRTIAQTTQGRYFVSATSYRDFERQFGEFLVGKESQQGQLPLRHRLGIHRFAWFVTPALLLLLLHSLLSDSRRVGTSAWKQPNYFSWVRRQPALSPNRLGTEIDKLRSLVLAGLCFITAASLAMSAGPPNVVGAWAALRRGNDLLRQAQQSGMNADPSTLLEAQRQYEACLSSQASMLNAGTLYQNARHNLEMTKLLMLQIGRNNTDGSQPASNEDRPNSQVIEVKDRPINDDSSLQANKRQQQPQDKSENCSTCLAGQNNSVNGRKMKEGGQGPGPGQGEASPSDRSSGKQTRESHSANAPVLPQLKTLEELAAGGMEKNTRSERGRETEVDASKLFHTEKSLRKPNRSTMAPESQGGSKEVESGRAKATTTMDARMQAARLRLQESIQRIEKRRGRAASNPDSGPEDPANQNRYRDW